ncbi:hypothetical protein CQ042_01235 [Microbacterium sp. MYb62]|nr:hypothetical protein CQ042_01235 [Microbacterium sp. MYb62]
MPVSTPSARSTTVADRGPVVLRRTRCRSATAVPALISEIQDSTSDGLMSPTAGKNQQQE